MEEDPFNPDYVEVDRVLEVSYCEDKDTGEVTFLVTLPLCCAAQHAFTLWAIFTELDASEFICKYLIGEFTQIWYS